MTDISAELHDTLLYLDGVTVTFDGFRALNFSTTVAGSHDARMLADIGAETITIESAEGKTMRSYHQSVASH